MIMYERQENIQSGEEIQKVDTQIQQKFINALS